MTLEGSAVVYPVHGVAEVAGTETRTVDGQTITYVILVVPGELRGDELRILVDQDRFDEIGIRPIMSEATAEDVLEVLAIVPRLSTTWARRFKNHQAKLKSGDVFELAEVVRNLAVLQRTKLLGPAEKSLYRQARSALVSELAVTWGSSLDDAAARMDRVLQVDSGI